MLFGPAFLAAFLAAFVLVIVRAFCGIGVRISTGKETQITLQFAAAFV
jgi:hypothetical protein